MVLLDKYILHKIIPSCLVLQRLFRHEGILSFILSLIFHMHIERNTPHDRMDETALPDVRGRFKCYGTYVPTGVLLLVLPL